VADDITPEASAGYAVRKMREDRNWSQRQVAQQMVVRGHKGWRQGTVSTTEAGQRPLRVNELVALADIFGATLDDLVMHNPFHGLSLSAARKELAQVKAQVVQLDREIDEARFKADKAEREVDGLTYSRNELVRLAGMLEDFIARGGDDQ
jgi:transcriptional regulator with XRE-family HTH domain